MTAEVVPFTRDGSADEGFDHDRGFPEPYRTLWLEKRKKLREELSRTLPGMETWADLLADEASRLWVVSIAGDNGAPGAEERRDTRALLTVAEKLVTKISRMPDPLSRYVAGELVQALVEAGLRAIDAAVEDDELHAMALTAHQEQVLNAFDRFALSRGWDPDEI